MVRSDNPAMLIYPIGLPIPTLHTATAAERIQDRQSAVDIPVTFECRTVRVREEPSDGNRLSANEK